MSRAASMIGRRRASARTRLGWVARKSVCECGAPKPPGSVACDDCVIRDGRNATEQAIISALRRHDGVTLVVLAQEIDRDVRTVQRYLSDLRERSALITIEEEEGVDSKGHGLAPLYRYQEPDMSKFLLGRGTFPGLTLRCPKCSSGKVREIVVERLLRYYCGSCDHEFDVPARGVR